MLEKDKKDIGDLLLDLAIRCKEGIIGLGKDCSHHPKGCPCETCMYKRMFRKDGKR